MRVTIKYGSKNFTIEVDDPAGATLGTLKELIYTATGVLPALQKLLGKPNLQTKPDSTYLAAVGIQDGTKLMLVGSAAAEIVKANTASGTDEKAKEQQKKLLRSLPYNFWLLPSYAGFLGDPYVGGRGGSLEHGTASLALLSMDVVLSRINTMGISGFSSASSKLLEALGKEGGASVSHRFLTGITDVERSALQKAHAVLRRCYEFTAEASRATKEQDVSAAVSRCVKAVEGLATGDWLMLPSGWRGLKHSNVLYLLLHRVTPQYFDLVVVNRGDGQTYHPQWQTAEKIRSCPYLCLDRIPAARLQDTAFWLLLHSLWMRANDPQNRSEFVRAEVFYDVLLPWLAEKAGGGGDANSGVQERFATEIFCAAHLDGNTGAASSSSSSSNSTLSLSVLAHGATQLCSESSAIKGAVSAFTYLMERFAATAPAGTGTSSLSPSFTKHIKYVLRYEFFLCAVEDLSSYARRFLPQTTTTAAMNPKLSPTATTTTEAAKKLKGSLEALQKIGVDDAASTLTVEMLFESAKKEDVMIKSAKNSILSLDHFQHKFTFVYVCQGRTRGSKLLTSQVSDTIAALRRADAARKAPPCELLVLCVDGEHDAFMEQLGLFSHGARTSFPAADLARALDVANVPQLMVFGVDGRLLHRDGLQAVRQDPDGLQYPSGPWVGANPLTATDARMLDIGMAQLAHQTHKRFARGQLERTVVSHVAALLQTVQALVEQLPVDNVQLFCAPEITSAQAAAAAAAARKKEEEQAEGEMARDASKVGLMALQRLLAQPVQLTPGEQFTNTELLPPVPTTAYYGKPFKTQVPSLADISDLSQATSYAELLVVLDKSRTIVESLWARAAHSGTASRVAIQMHIIEYISWVFTKLVPVPLPPTASAEEFEAMVPPPERQTVSRFYTEDSFPAAGEHGPDVQLKLLECIHFLMLSLANAWQAVETPTRSYDAERCLIAMMMLLVFDAILRQIKGSEKTYMVTMLLRSDGGYYPSTTLGRSNLDFATVAATLELTHPSLLLIRSAVLRYIAYQKKEYRYELFDMRMPDKLEVRKNDSTMTFLRMVLDNAGYALDASGGLVAGSSEMDKLADWLCSPRSPLAREHPEYILLRDMVLLAKFLGTMEMRDAQLLRRRKEADPLASWTLSFDEDTPGRQMSAGWRTRPAAPKWECGMVRGRDMDIADILVKGFGDREVLYGEGLALHSPIAVDKLIEVERPTEDDVLHATSLPKFGGALNAEEAEVLLSCLTTPYIRIPLLLEFFASQDRHTYLFEPQVQAVLRALLFEPATYVSPERQATADVQGTPMRLNRKQREEVELAHLRGDFSKQNNEDCLGTTYGLLLNELTHAPAGVLRPLERILRSVTELGPSSVYSANASFVLFMVHLVSDVLAFCRFVLERKLSSSSSQEAVVRQYHAVFLALLQETIMPLLQGWLQESEGNADTPTQCVVYSYKSMMDRTLWQGMALAEDPHGDHSNSVAFLEKFLQSSTFVRARHGFGMGMQRTQLAARDGDDLLTPEEKVLRFLQAQGLDTSKVTTEMLEEGKRLMMSGGRRRAVFVHIRSRHHSDTVRMPNLFHSDPKSTTESKQLKLPPADVMEHVLFHHLLEDHLKVIHYLDTLSAARRDAVFKALVQCVLLDHEEEEGSASGDQSRRRSLGSAPHSHVVSTANLEGLGGGSSGHGSWKATAPGTYKGPKETGLLFHAQTCELFWRNDELKPVPDSMSHFTDFETILGKEILQCGLVSRHEHRHWVHIVGTVYDVVEWTSPPSLINQGAHSPLIITGEFPKEMVESAVYNGVTYDRLVDVEEDLPWPVREERWAVDLLRHVMQGAFTEMRFAPLAAQRKEVQSERDKNEKEKEGGDTVPVPEMHFIMNDAAQYEGEEDRATWKEVVAYYYPQPYLELYNLVPHARKLYRSLVFTTNQRYCLHSVALTEKTRSREALHLTAFQGGDLKRRTQRESSLEIHRYNDAIRGREMYLPSRLLQGLLPSVLLESFMLWQGEDGVLRGYPIAEDTSSTRDVNFGPPQQQQQQTKGGAGGAGSDPWFNYLIEVHFGTQEQQQDEHNGGGPSTRLLLPDYSNMVVVRRDVHKPYTPIHPTTAKSQSASKMLVRHRKGDVKEKKTKKDEDVAVTVTAVDEEEDVHLVADAALLHATFLHYPEALCRHLLTEYHTRTQPEEATTTTTSGNIGAVHVNDISEVIAWVSSAENADTIQSIAEAFYTAAEKEAAVAANSASPTATADASTSTSTTTPATTAAAATTTAQQGFRLEDDDLVLLNLRRCAALRPLLKLFTCVEDCSHILVWGRPIGQKGDRTKKGTTSANEEEEEEENCILSEGGARCRLAFVELPRLRVKFAVLESADEAGRARLHLADQPDWYVADLEDFTDHARPGGEDGRSSSGTTTTTTIDASQAHLLRQLRSLQGAFQQHLLLCNTTREMSFMVPNHDFKPMPIDGDPFQTLLLFDRSSYIWRESVASPVYRFLVHASRQFVIPATLAASLYYAVLQCATQHYAGALRTLESCYTDTAFTSEEAFMFHLFERTIGDGLPDAHAVRLKLAHAVQYSENTYRWTLADELEGYLSKVRHVSRDCRLHRKEVLDLVKRCTKAVPLVRSQLELYAGLLQRTTAGTGTADGDLNEEEAATRAVALKTPAMDRCGYPWDRLLLPSWEKISGQKPRRVTFRPLTSENLSETKLIEFVWSDQLLMDEEGGSNTRLGFLLLYGLLKGDMKPSFLQKDVTGTLGALLTRWFHLRHARWGREAVSEGEQEVRLSWCATVLQLMELSAPSEWPSFSAVRDRAGLSRGTDTVVNPHVLNNDAPLRRSDVPDFFDKINRKAKEVFNVEDRASATHVHRTRQARSRYFERMPTEHTITVEMFDHLKESRIVPADTATSQLQLREEDFPLVYFGESREQRRTTLQALSSRPLQELELTGSIILESSRKATATEVKSGQQDEEEETNQLPFDLRRHPLAQLPMSQDMLRRLADDAGCFGRQQAHQVRYHFAALQAEKIEELLSCTSHGALEAAVQQMQRDLETCQGRLAALRRADEQRMAQLSDKVRAVVNTAAAPKAGTGTTNSPAEDAARQAWELHQLRLAARDCTPVSYEWVCSSLLSTQMEEEILSVNPFLQEKLSTFRALLVLLLLTCNRLYFVEQCALALQHVRSFVQLCYLLRGGALAAAATSEQDGEGDAATKQHQREEEEEAFVHSLAQQFSLEVQPEVLKGILAQRRQPKEELTVLSEEVRQVLLERLRLLCAAALDLLLSERYYVETSWSDNRAALTLTLDPRFLLFEFLFNIMLRARQVEMVNWFVANIHNGQSRVQQMIMGQGKTTVVGPLLALMLADGAHLVMQVMPTSLLEQTRGILRRCFGVVLVKHIYSIQFDRNYSEDDADIELLYQKLKSAEEDRSVVIAAPECVKSLFLKGIEQMHVLDTVETKDLQQAALAEIDERQTSHAHTLLRKTIQRSTLADAITPILQLWKRGVLIMDEVDVLLHPLRSELNFPIGLKHPIDLSGPRWRLPIHLLDAIFFFRQGRATEDVQEMMNLREGNYFSSTSYALHGEDEDEAEAQSSTAELSTTTTTISGKNIAQCRQKEALRQARLATVRATIHDGFKRRALQREPHLVLLDLVYYETELLPALVPWLQLWLYEQLVEERVALGTEEETPVWEEAEEDSSNSTTKDTSPPQQQQQQRKLFPRSLLDFERRTTVFFHSPAKDCTETKETIDYLNHHLSPASLKLMNLSHDWLHRLLPHVLSKIDRVGFGLLRPSDMANSGGSGGGAAGAAFTAEDRMPYSRQVMAVPFVAKDVPSRSSEFAHPDVVIGLTVLAYRYEGLRQRDVKGLLTQLKQDFARQAGPKEHRPAAVLYRRWLSLSQTDHKQQQQQQQQQQSRRRGSRKGEDGEKEDGEDRVAEGAGVPLSQLQVSDRVQMRALHHVLRHVPEVAHYYLCSCIFPRTMNFQQLKISACGHELGSSMLFDKRIGFSGTPSNLLPLDLGECYYEPGSDGRVLSVLTNPQVTRTELLPDNWTALSVLDRIAAAQPPFAALIDAGALITNMDNEDVARYLLARLPEALFDGVVYLDQQDRQVILQRDSSGHIAVPVAQCGIPLSRRFTFFDQVHTTGTDVRQAATASAVITLGKDLVFRDYAQGAYRMRGIGRGQRLTVYLIPEVVTRLQETLATFQTKDLLRDVPAWLLLNSMKIESLQFFKLSSQEVANVWRKKALYNLISDSVYANAHKALYSGYLRCRRFQLARPVSGADKDAAAALPAVSLLKASIQEFREIIEYVVETSIHAPPSFLTHLQDVLTSRPAELLEGDTSAQAIVSELMKRMQTSVAAAAATDAGGAGGAGAALQQAHRMVDLNAEIVHEQEAEEEQEQEAEQEEQRISAFSRDDEFQVPWKLTTLLHAGSEASETVRPCHGSPFYQIREFVIHGASGGSNTFGAASQATADPILRVPPQYLLSDNFYRLQWHGVGERRLKNTFLYAQWAPQQKRDGAALPAAASGADGRCCYGLVTLAEGESLRWLLHHSHRFNDTLSVSLRSVASGRHMDCTQLFLQQQQQEPLPPQSPDSRAAAATVDTLNNASNVSLDCSSLLFRFFNNDMFFSDAQLQVLEELLREVPPEERLHFFQNTLRVRRRHRNHWEDAPIAVLFVTPRDRPHLRALAVASRVRATMEEMAAVVLRAALPTSKRTDRREAAAVEEQLCQFASEVTSALSAAHGADGSAAAALPSQRIAQLLCESFPKYFEVYSTSELAPALLLAVSRTGDAESSSSRKDNSTRLSAPSTIEAAIPLARLYKTYPALDLVALREHAEGVRGGTKNADGKEAATAAAAAAAPWQCEACTYMNDADTRVCAMCMAVAPSRRHVEGDPTAAPETKVDGDDDKEEADEDGPWACPVCTFVNDSRASLHCHVCLAENPSPWHDPATRQQQQQSGTNPLLDVGWECPEGYWVCSVENGGCSKYNPNSVFYCQVCEKARPNLATIRF